MKKLISLAVTILIVTAASFAQKKNLKTETFKVFGTCEQCKDRIETTLSEYGVYKSDWNIESNYLTVTYDSTKFNKSKIQRKLASVGHDTEEFQATDKVYNKLPLCCHYERYRTHAEHAAADSSGASGEKTITGIVLEETKKGKMLPLNKATIHILGSNNNSTTDSMGVFYLHTTLPVTITISYVGFRSDTIAVNSPDVVTVILKNASTTNLRQVVVTARQQSTYVSSLSTFNTLNIGSRELAKAACCNLSESFETSPSVDVSYSDAVTGIKQIQLLGLSGNYTQITTENVPEIKGLPGSYGLTFIPGPWLESVQVTKGTGSVVNGYESIAGQINIEEKKPDKSDKLYINGYVNTMGRMETSIDAAHIINNKWSTSLLTHANGVAAKTDANKDGFLDIPLGRQFNVINRWKYADTKGWIGQLSIKALNDRRQAGENDFDPATDKLSTHHYGVGIKVQQYAATGKLGYVFPQSKYKSIGLMLSYSDYKNDSYYGLNKYDGQQGSFYANLIYQSIIASTIHKFRTGLSYMNDRFDETFNAGIFHRHESVPGAFFEYTYTPGSKFTAIAGFRIDHHNLYGWVPTPRLHLKYDVTPKTNLRFSAGSGFRVANIFTENQGVFVSSRQYSILNPTNTYGYGLDPEKAWNIGFNFIHNFKLNHRNASFSFDAYHTYFNNQTVTDVDANPQKVMFYNLNGKSFSTSLQAELNMEIIHHLEVRLAYRWLDVQTDFSGTVLQKSLVAKNRSFINIAYETNNHWKFDVTNQWFGRKRLPITVTNPADKQLSAYSPSFMQMSGQVTKVFSKQWEVYLGAENITNFTQKKPILSAEQPFSPYFDGSMTWGPVNERVFYLGFRFRIKN